MRSVSFRLMLASSLAVTGLSGLSLPVAAETPSTSPTFLLRPVHGTVAAASVDNASPLNTPITGAATAPTAFGGHAPPSLSALQAARPPIIHGKPVSPMRGHALREAALSYGARGGLAAQSYAINIMLLQNQARLDRTFDFSRLVVPVSNGQTLMAPPIVTEAQMAFALAPGGQVAKQTDRVYQITQEARLASAPPNWRTYLVRSWADPAKPPRDLLPRTRAEAVAWTAWVAKGWALGEQQGTQIFLDDLDRLKQDYIGMVRYRVLLTAGLVEAPTTVFHDQAISGGRDRMLVGNQVIRITNQPGLNPAERQWRHPYIPEGGPVGGVP
jgi:defect-in-organelle-trafficking protein DotC